MDLTKSSWTQTTKQMLIEDITSADYIAIDTELTGIDINSKNIFDVMEKRYIKLAKTASRYNIMQLGICTFKKDNSNNKLNYICKPYNIYVFPLCSDRKMTMEISAIYFNSKNNFDFNKWIKHGIPYINNEEVEKERKILIEKNLNNFKSTSPINIFKEEAKEKYNELKIKIDDFMKDNDKRLLIFEKPQNFILYSILENMSMIVKNSIYIEESKLESKDNSYNKDKSVILFHKIGSHKEKEEKLNNFYLNELPKQL